jgi:hypothetical protein
MKLPERITADWASSLADEQLVNVEATLHAQFAKEETAEKKRMGARYEMLRGSALLVSAWLRWLTVNNETRARGVVVRRKSS